MAANPTPRRAIRSIELGEIADANVRPRNVE